MTSSSMATASPNGVHPTAEPERAAGMAGPEPILQLSDLRAGYGAIEVLHGIDLMVPAGGIFAVLGPNGAGKSTLLKVLAGLHPVSGGTIVMAGREVNRARPDDLARSGLCLIPEGRGVFANLTVEENLRLITHLGARSAEIEERTYARFPQLAVRRKQVAGTMSGGEQQMLALARSVATDPGLLLIDELSMGLAPRIVEMLYELVAEIARTGVTVIAVEQFARTNLGIASSAVVITTGRVVLAGRPDEVESKLSGLYLGNVAD
ncbi:MAG: branched-chain amino acid transport system ATP-binding protein [Pseudonocardiales bacterium]|nr:branched-chain amino acid transport system ATP-binding protein [Pseudonocardiales bacterium]